MMCDEMMGFCKKKMESKQFFHEFCQLHWNPDLFKLFLLVSLFLSWSVARFVESHVSWWWIQLPDRAFTLSHKCCIETWLQVRNVQYHAGLGDCVCIGPTLVGCTLRIPSHLLLIYVYIYISLSRCSELDFNFATCLHFIWVKIAHGIMTACSKEKGPHQT